MSIRYCDRVDNTLSLADTSLSGSAGWRESAERVLTAPAYLGVDVGDFLDRATFARSAVSCSYDAAICALS